MNYTLRHGFKLGVIADAMFIEFCNVLLVFVCHVAVGFGNGLRLHLNPADIHVFFDIASE